MASTVRVVLVGGRRHGPSKACREALDVFGQVEAQCSRFDPGSDLSRANGSPDRWHRVGRHCYDAVVEAWRAYRRTAGRFDPRVLADLLALGYDRWPPDGAARPGRGDGAGEGSPAAGRAPRGAWRPRFTSAECAVHLDGCPIDLGGIGKGLAVRWASRTLGARDHLIEAGGDCYCAGRSPEGGAWRIAVEDPRGGDVPLAVLGVSDLACATSSVRRRSWVSGGRPLHHLVDPSTGLPGGDGLLSVTIVAADPADAEVWSKVLFLCGAASVGAAARRHDLAALWVTGEGALHAEGRAAEHVLWRR